MPKQDRIKTKYPGVYYITNGKEKTFYIIYYLNRKKIEEKAGRQFVDDMTAAKAAGIRAERSKGTDPSNETRPHSTLDFLTPKEFAQKEDILLENSNS